MRKAGIVLIDREGESEAARNVRRQAGQELCNKWNAVESILEERRYMSRRERYDEMEEFVCSMMEDAPSSMTEEEARKWATEKAKENRQMWYDERNAEQQLIEEQMRALDIRWKRDFEDYNEEEPYRNYMEARAEARESAMREYYDD